MTELSMDSDGVYAIAMVCGYDGVVRRVVHDALGILTGTVVGQPLTRIMDHASAEKSENFVAEAVATGAAFDWELSMPYEGAVRLLHFAAVTADADTLIVVGAPTRAAVLRYYDELMRINNEQTNALRSAVKGRFAAGSRSRDDDLYDKLMRLNNELATLQRELTKKNMELERVNRLKNQFMGMAAHDLRNPIGAIRSFATLLLDESVPVTPERRQDFLRRIRGSSEFMLALIDDLLDLAAIESGQLRMDTRLIDIMQLVRDNVDVNRMLGEEKRITISLQLASDVPHIVADPLKIEQVLNNLISNALKFSERDTTVRVSLHAEESGVSIIVADEGPGIPEAEIAQIFQPFRRATPRGTAGERSTGLGLAIVKRVVDGHDGRLTCESVVGQGTTFSIWLPAGGPQSVHGNARLAVKR